MEKVEYKDVELLYGNEGIITDDVDQALQIFKERGVVILTNVLNDEECQQMRDGAWDTAEFLTEKLPIPVDRYDQATYTSLRFLQPYHGGLYQHHRWGHAKYVWDVRQNPKVIKFHQKYYGIKKKKRMLVSMDGIHFAPGYRKYDGHYSVHIDQGFGPDKTGEFRCIQSWVTSEDIEVGDGTFRYLEDSHLLHDDFCEQFGLEDHKSDWVMVGGKDKTDYYRWYEEKGCRDICITCPAGSMVFWDSRMVHSGIERMPFSKPKLRNIVYVCYMPREDCEKTLKKRKQIFNPVHSYFMRNASHWPDRMILFGKYPMDRYFRGNKYDKEKMWSVIPKIPSPEEELTNLGRKIAGLD
jgi:hypothetical protein